MGTKRLLDHDRETGTSIYHYYDNQTDKTIIETVQNVEPYLERNKRLANENTVRDLARKQNFVRVGSIPIGVQHEWMKKYGIMNVYGKEYRQKVLKLLQSAEYKYLRTVTGRFV